MMLLLQSCKVVREETLSTEVNIKKEMRLKEHFINEINDDDWNVIKNTNEITSNQMMS